MGNYSGQFETDKVIEAYFPGKIDGEAIEVGASHGTVSSNTLYFEQLGWTCLCIEPNPSLYAQLKNNRKLTLNYAVADFNSEAVDFNIVTLNNGDTTAISGLCLDERLLQTHPVASTTQCTVKTRTLDACLFGTPFTPGEIDFVSIDTEGTELDVLRGFSLDCWKPKLLVIENNFLDSEVKNYLLDFGYSFQERYVINDFYTRD